MTPGVRDVIHELRSAGGEISVAYSPEAGRIPKSASSEELHPQKQATSISDMALLPCAIAWR